MVFSCGKVEWVRMGRGAGNRRLALEMCPLPSDIVVAPTSLLTTWYHFSLLVDVAKNKGTPNGWFTKEIPYFR